MYNLSNFKSDIKKETDLTYLNNILNVYIKKDRDNLNDIDSVKIHAKMRNISTDEYIRKTTGMIDEMEKAVLYRIKELSY